MLKSNIVAKITEEIFREDTRIITKIPKESQEAWQVNLTLRDYPKLIPKVNTDLIDQDLANWLIVQIKRDPKSYAVVVEDLPKKYHTADIADAFMSALKNYSQYNDNDQDLIFEDEEEEDMQLDSEKEFKDDFSKYFSALREDLITKKVYKFLREYRLDKVIQNLSPKIKRRFINFMPFKKDIKRTNVPKNLDKMQVVILRYMRNNNLKVINVPQLKKANLVTPDTEKMIHFYNGKPLTIKDILNYKVQDEQESQGSPFNFIRKNLKPVYLGDHITMQRLFSKKKNHIFGLVITKLDVLLKKYPALEEPLTKVETHFSSPIKNTVVLGWVRYTKFEKDIWIDEIQSDLTNDDEFKELLGNDTIKVYDLILNEFIRNMHRRGSGKLVIPTHELKIKMYEDYGKNRPPKYVYDKLPKKFRFKKDTITNIDDKVDGLDSWILAHVKS